MTIKFIFFLLCLGIVSILSGSRAQTSFAKARFANRWEKIRHCYTAKVQLQQNRIDRVCLYCGSYPQWQMWGFLPALIILLTGKPPTIFVTTANKGIDIIGVTGSGKTFSAIDPLCASAIEQKFPLLVYDAKGKERGESGQIPFLATYALRQQLQCSYFCPWKKAFLRY